jgi:hypothetical protein
MLTSPSVAILRESPFSLIQCLDVSEGNCSKVKVDEVLGRGSSATFRPVASATSAYVRKAETGQVPLRLDDLCPINASIFVVLSWF